MDDIADSCRMDKQEVCAFQILQMPFMHEFIGISLSQVELSCT